MFCLWSIGLFGGGDLLIIFCVIVNKLSDIEWCVGGVENFKFGLLKRFLD